MATTRQKQAARRNIAKARKVQSSRARGKSVPRRTPGLSTAAQNRLPDSAFAFPEQRKEPLTDADRDRAWRRIRTAARKFDVEISERGWRQLFEGGKAKKR